MMTTWTRSEFDREYYRYLVQKVGDRPGYDEVLRLLYSKDFVSLVPNDDNRAGDGLGIRAEFVNLEDLPVLPDWPCNVLEMLVGLSERIAYIVYDPDLDISPNAKRAFWELIDNLGLKPGWSVNDKRLEIFLRRQYNVDGLGGLFPLTWPKMDQTKVEIWYQMMAYLNERYFHRMKE